MEELATQSQQLIERNAELQKRLEQYEPSLSVQQNMEKAIVMGEQTREAAEQQRQEALKSIPQKTFDTAEQYINDTLELNQSALELCTRTSTHARMIEDLALTIDGQDMTIECEQYHAAMTVKNGLVARVEGVTIKPLSGANPIAVGHRCRN